MLSHRTGHHKVPGLQPLNLRMAAIPKIVIDFVKAIAELRFLVRWNFPPAPCL